MERVARRLVPAPLDFEAYVAQFPTDLIDLVDRAHGRRPRTLRQHHDDYLARCADPTAQAALARAVHQQRRRNVAARNGMEDA